jgi:signal-transduction protein with cAMP-binding, CBS, and nucleotidyltransferase domain
MPGFSFQGRKKARRKEVSGMYTTITIGCVLRSKGHGYWGIGSRASAYEALEIMAEKEIGALMVVDEGKLVGVFSERDYARKVILKGKSSKTTTVEELMSSPPICGGPHLTLKEAMVLMTANRIRHLPVLDNGQLTGVVTIGDVVNAIITCQAAEISQLENYITCNDYAARLVASS